MRQTIKGKLRHSSLNGRLALIGFLPIGYPTPDAFRENVRICVEEGVDLIELGLPVADPYLDGSVIRNAYQEILQTNITPRELMAMGGAALIEADALGMALVYTQSVQAFGAEEFFNDLSAFGYKGVLIPNVKPDERKTYWELASGNGLEIMGFVPAESHPDEVEDIINHSSGFIYMQGVAGSTGQQIKVDQALMHRYHSLKSAAQRDDLPVLVGFGIRDAEDLANLRRIKADGAIIGTAFVQAGSKTPAEFRQYVNSLAGAIVEEGAG